MPKYRYKAVTVKGRRVIGTLEANSIRLARDELTSRGYWITDLTDTSELVLYRDISFGGPKVKPADFTVFCRQLATMYRAGVTLVESLQILSDQATAKIFKNVLSKMTDDMREGKQFSEAAASYPTIFNNIFISMVKAGEIAGNLDTMLERLAVFYEKEHRMREKVKSAMVYPALMLVLMVAVVIFMMLFVIPQFASSFAGMGIELPLPTRIVMSMSEFVQSFWYIVILLLFAPFVAWNILRRNPLFVLQSDRLLLKVPVFGKLAHKQALARFSRTFSSLLSAAIPLMQGLSIVSNVVGNAAMGRVVLNVRDNVLNGDSMSSIFGQSKLFPIMIVQMIAIGERSGSIDSMLEKVADFYEEEVEQMADRLKSLLEPLMILALASVVGLIVLAIMTPTFKLMQEML